jgi:hypothetical protein
MPPTMDDKIRSKAVAAARKRKKPGEPLMRSEALTEAPWEDHFPPAWERPFREAYADELANRGEEFAAPKTKRKSTGKGGNPSSLPRFQVGMTREEFEEQKAKAEKLGLKWSVWARRKLSEP